MDISVVVIVITAIVGLLVANLSLIYIIFKMKLLEKAETLTDFIANTEKPTKIEVEVPMFREIDV